MRVMRPLNDPPHRGSARRYPRGDRRAARARVARPRPIANEGEQAADVMLLGAGDAGLEAIYANGKLRFCFLHTGSLDRNELRERFDVGGDD
jgi:hypothetical protein